MQYPISPVSRERLFMLSLRGFWPALRAAFVSIVIFVALKSLFSYLPKLTPWLETILSIIFLLLAIFLYIFSLYCVDGEWRGNPLSLAEAWQRTLKNLLKVYLASFGIIAALLLIFFLVRWLTFSVFHLGEATAGLVMLMFAGIPMISVLIYFYLMLPLLTVHEQSWPSAFYQSALFARENLVIMLVIYFEMVVMLIISSSYTGHGQWLLHHHLMEVCDLLVFSLIAPLLLNLTLLLLNNEFAHQSQP